MEFIAIAVGFRFFNQCMQPFGFSVKDAFKVEFDWPIIKECLWFGFQVSIIPSINTITSTWMLVMYVDALPQYTSFVFIAELARGIGSVVNLGSSFKLTPSIAESYPNGKVQLALYYVQTNIKWAGFFMMLLLGVVGGYIPLILSRLVEIPALNQYAAAVDFLPFVIIQSLFMFFVSLPDPILLGTMRVSFYTFVRLIEEFLQVFFVWFFLYGLRLHETLGPIGIAIIFGWEHFFPRLIKMGISYIYINHRIFRIKMPWMQALVIPFISCIPSLIMALIWRVFVFNVLYAFAGLYLSIGITILVGVVVMPLLAYLPLTGYLGGWDDRQLQIFEKSVDLS